MPQQSRPSALPDMLPPEPVTTAGPDAPAAGAPARERIIRRKLSDEVFDRLREMIVSGQLKPGDPMPSERDLMDRFGVGRPAVREALQQMHTMGLITIAHGERSRVNTLSAGSVLDRVDQAAQLLLSAAPDQLDYLKEARRMFECGLVRLAAERASATDVAELRALNRHQAAQLSDPTAFIAADMAFHARIAAISGNPIMGAVSEAMLKWLFRYHEAVLYWSGNEDKTLAEHDLIVDRIAAGDPAGAVAQMVAHLDRSAALIHHS